MNNEVRKKYIEGNITMELAEAAGSDLFEIYLINKIDEIDEAICKFKQEEIYPIHVVASLMGQKELLNQVREAYYNLKK